MSVRLGDRAGGKLKVLDLSRKLCVYTIRACRKDKIFPKSQRWIMVKKLVDECLDALICIRRANSVRYTNKESQEYNYRVGQQTEAYAHLEAFLSLLDIAYEVFSIDDHKIEVWTGMAVETEEKLKAWMKYDKSSTG